MSDLDLERAERLAAEFWTEPGDQQAARTLLVALVARVRALTEAGDTMAARLSVAIDEGRNVVPDATDDQAALIEVFAIEAVSAWRTLADG